MIKFKSAAEIEQMKKAGALSKMALRHVGAMIRPGVSTFELDQLAEQIIRMHGGTPAFKGYGGFPGSICASLNDAVVHGIPNPDVILRDGDVISIDTGAIVRHDAKARERLVNAIAVHEDGDLGANELRISGLEFLLSHHAETALPLLDSGPEA